MSELPEKTKKIDWLRFPLTTPEDRNATLDFVNIAAHDEDTDMLRQIFEAVNTWNVSDRERCLFLRRLAQRIGSIPNVRQAGIAISAVHKAISSLPAVHQFRTAVAAEIASAMQHRDKSPGWNKLVIKMFTQFMEAGVAVLPSMLIMVMSRTRPFVFDGLVRDMLEHRSALRTPHYFSVWPYARVISCSKIEAARPRNPLVRAATDPAMWFAMVEMLKNTHHLFHPRILWDSLCAIMTRMIHAARGDRWAPDTPLLLDEYLVRRLLAFDELYNPEAVRVFRPFVRQIMDTLQSGGYKKRLDWIVDRFTEVGLPVARSFRLPNKKTGRPTSRGRPVSKSFRLPEKKKIGLLTLRGLRDTGRAISMAEARQQLRRARRARMAKARGFSRQRVRKTRGDLLSRSIVSDRFVPRLYAGDKAARNAIRVLAMARVQAIMERFNRK